MAAASIIGAINQQPGYAGLVAQGDLLLPSHLASIAPVPLLLKPLGIGARLPVRALQKEARRSRRAPSLGRERQCKDATERLDLFSRRRDVPQFRQWRA